MKEAWFWKPWFMRQWAWRLALKGRFRAGWGRYSSARTGALTTWPWWWPLAVVEYSPHTIQYRAWGFSGPMPLGDAMDHADEMHGAPITLDQAQEKKSYRVSCMAVEAMQNPTFTRRKSR